MISCKSNKKYSFLLALLFSFLTVFSSFAQGEQASVSQDGVTAGAAGPDVQAGGTLFKNNCASCHAINEKVVGPALRDIHKKHKLPWLISWIRNSSKMVQSGDKQAVQIFNEYDKQQMPSFAFSDEEITSIVKYIEAESAAPVATTAPTGGNANDQTAQAATDGPGGESIGDAGKYLNFILIALIVLLIVMVITLLIIANLMKDYLRGKKDLEGNDIELVEQRWDFSKVYKSRAVQVIAGLIFFCVLLDIAIEETYGVGLSQGYQPRQPIAFSHKLHAGEHQINCNYCHTSVYKSASANIPSANICMNCHSQIKKDSPEIQKIYSAIEKNKPIEWVRVHNLPDFSYFNHSQHTKVGGIECQTCHGPIESMNVVYQYSPLTMGWCINCHRETPLNTEGNKYYDNLVKLHDEANKGAAFTVASNGGAECSKCHY
ncbi:c-type cytochrome [Adhaeribacter aquaticus]|uniref:c-type cytochrome n=1 Tax=Adhaeribacter aquaticus TaxID=299567 RepID=UPI0003F4BD81|nr:c-type cytochrome [Adhaeribacter aquaticus]